jgi:hypothetical protein
MVHIHRRLSEKLGVKPRALSSLALAGGAWLFVGCASQPSDAVLYDEVVFTQYNKAASFGSYQTFAVNPTVSIITDNGSGDSSDDDDADADSALPAQAAAPIVNAVVQEMIQAGYQQVGTDGQPDIGIDLVVLNTTRIYMDTYYWWGWGWYGYPGYWGYPGYAYWAPWVTYSSYRTGTLVVQAFDLKAPRVPPPDGATLPDGSVPPKLTIPLLWGATIYSVLSEVASTNIQDAVSGVQQAFAQSPYFVR